tara:strand:- start:20748 stop:21029 length:282 start_codon:yes stop_codon:yes gene_type:complete
MVNILMLDGWTEDGSKLKFTKEDSSLKYLEGYASELHNGVEGINKILKESKYVINTWITGEENNYELSVKIKYYGKKSKYEHKKNSHRQKINI